MRLITAIVGGLAFSSYYIDAAPHSPRGPKNLGIRFGIYDPNPLAAPHHYGVCKAEFPMPSAGEVQRITGKIVSAVIARNLLPKPLRLILSRMPCAGTTFRFHFARFQSISDFSLEANHEITDPSLTLLVAPNLKESRWANGTTESAREVGHETATDLGNFIFTLLQSFQPILNSVRNPPANAWQQQYTAWQARVHQQQQEQAMIEAQRLRLFGGEVGEEASLCAPMLQVVMDLFDGIDYVDP
ncbi:hypothetical protein H2199_006995 [Coniosporium tulheliwenetii]|uniref:Uncharacterized protein n=1 Tax=Coniosporium tulheliwenetii TaxID=3383036 RepID=A0ACC2YSH9_9PEZI|nr:hypothetical protein H2199_006995 [Cladosporium sp. JES 115]